MNVALPAKLVDVKIKVSLLKERVPLIPGIGIGIGIIPILTQYRYRYRYKCLSSIGIGMNHQPCIGIGMNVSLVSVSVWWYRWNSAYREIINYCHMHSLNQATFICLTLLSIRGSGNMSYTH